ncbi:hypothetical protein [Arthrobacter sunyaminii]|uniref:hypothetical protein n=1 Tax=Arthrobacter sunyaminii TaxID=2816859 RepID=UPI001A94BB7A|nr:hypothetical protein [Arthrobacter sunyaminii]MBO0896928.1 hypothetical protein [Arthrobacter sunyaminii]
MSPGLNKYVPAVHLVPAAEAAEMTKLLENTFRAVAIALANKFADICGALDIPVTDVIDAADTKPFGFMRFNSVPGVGGHCIHTPHTDFDPSWLASVPAVLGAAYRLPAGPIIIAL